VQTDNQFREDTVEDRGEYVSDLYDLNETAMQAVATAAATALNVFQAAAAAAQSLWTEGFVAAWNDWEDGLNGAYLDATTAQNGADEAESDATAVADNTYAHSVDGAEEAEANGVASALNDQIARQEEGAARKTEAELLAQAQYDLDKAKADRTYRNDLAAAAVTHTSSVSAAAGQYAIDSDQVDVQEAQDLKDNDVDWFTALGSDNDTLAEDLAEGRVAFHQTEATNQHTAQVQQAIVTSTALDSTLAAGGRDAESMPS
jgi:hypothetical protein